MPRPAKIQKRLPDGYAPAEGGKINLRQAIDLRVKGLSYQEIADYFGVRKQSVWDALQPYGLETNGSIEVFKEKRADILAGKQADCLAALTVDDIKKASPRDKAIIFGTLYDKERLERGQSTVNLASIYSQALEHRGAIEVDGEVVDAPDDHKI